MKHSRSVALAALTVAVALGGCSSPAPAADSVLTLAAGGPAVFDIVAGLPLTSFVNEPVFDTLWTPGPGDDFSPHLAESWEILDDGTTLRVHLREGVTDTNGDVFDAAALQLALQAKKDNDTFARMPFVESIEVIDDLTVVLRSSQYDPQLMTNLSVDPVVSPAMIGAEDASTNPVGTGAYRLDDGATTHDVEYVFHKRDDAWNAAAYEYDTVVVKIIPDEVARLNALKSGQVDVAAINTNSSDEATESGLGRVVYSIIWWGMNLGGVDGAVEPAIADLRVRQAISMAFDREGVNTSQYFGLARPTNQAFGPDSGYYHADREDDYPYDPAAARELLADAGYPDGFSLSIPTYPGYAEFEPIVEQVLADIGIAVTFDPVHPDAASYFAEGGSTAAVSMITTCFCATLDALTGGIGTTFWTATDPDLLEQAAIVRAGGSTPEERRAAEARIGDLVLDNAWVVAVNATPSVWAFSSDVEVAPDLTQSIWPEPFLFQISAAG